MLEINLYSHNAILVVELKGALNSHCAPDVRKWFETQVVRGSIYIAIDLLDVEYISSMGISSLLELHSLVKQAQGYLVLFNANNEIKNVFNFLKLDKKICILSSTEEAISKVVQYKQDYPVKKVSEITERLNALPSISDDSNKTDSLNSMIVLEQQDSLTIREIQSPDEPFVMDLPNESEEKEIIDQKSIGKEQKSEKEAVINNFDVDIKPLTINVDEIFPTQVEKKINHGFEILNCPNCKKKMKIKGGGQFMCPRCHDGILLVEDTKKLKKPI